MGLTAAQMYAKVSRRALGMGQYYASAYSDAMRNSLVVLTREYVYNSATHQWDRTEGTVIYDDTDFPGIGAPAGITSTTGPMVLDFASEETSYDTIKVMFPLSMPVEPRKDDKVIITSSPDRGFTGRSFYVSDVVNGGRMAASITVTAVGEAPSKENA